MAIVLLLKDLISKLFNIAFQFTISNFFIIIKHINLTSSIETQKVCEIGLSFISTKQIGKIRFSENKIFRLINEKSFIKVKFAVPFFLGMKCFVSISKGKAIQIIE